jgi:hypothetical protein
MRVEDRGNGTIGIMYFDDQYDCTDTLDVKLELPKFGAFHAGTDENYYVLTGQDNPDELDTMEVFRITKYDKNWQMLGYSGLLGANTVEPMRSSATRMTDDGDFLFVRSSHKMYKSEKDGKNHQASVTIQVDKKTMEIVDAQTRVINEGYGYTSHSFDAYVRVKDDHLVVASLGDAYPRGIYLGRCKKKTSEKKVDCAFNHCTVQEIPGKIGQNATGVSMGGLEFSDSTYILVYNCLDSAVSVNYLHRTDPVLLFDAVVGNNGKCHAVNPVFIDKAGYRAIVFSREKVRKICILFPVPELDFKRRALDRKLSPCAFNGNAESRFSDRADLVDTRILRHFRAPGAVPASVFVLHFFCKRSDGSTRLLPVSNGITAHRAKRNACSENDKSG